VTGTAVGAAAGAYVGGPTGGVIGGAVGAPGRRHGEQLRYRPLLLTGRRTKGVAKINECPAFADFLRLAPGRGLIGKLLLGTGSERHGAVPYAGNARSYRHRP
jgi:hypothetical protein